MGAQLGRTVWLSSSIISKVVESLARSPSSIARTGVIAPLCASKIRCSSRCSQKKTSAGLARARGGGGGVGANTPVCEPAWLA